MDVGTVLSALGLMAQGGSEEGVSKDDLDRLRKMTQKNRDSGQEAAGMAAGTEPYGYQYRNRAQQAGAPSGQRYGVLAQDLEKSPMGKQFVNRDPATGYKTVDTPGLTLANTAAIGQLVRETRGQQQQQTGALDAMRKEKATADYQGQMARINQTLARLRGYGSGL